MSRPPAPRSWPWPPGLAASPIPACWRLGLTGAEEVLEVGAGYGYQTALLARLAARVVSIDIWPDLAARARRNLAAQGIGNVVVLAGDGTEGAPDLAPFDAIAISAACPRVPVPLPTQLRAGGRLVQLIGPGGAERFICVIDRRPWPCTVAEPRTAAGTRALGCDHCRSCVVTGFAGQVRSCIRTRSFRILEKEDHEMAITVAEKVLIAGGVLNLAYGMLLGYPITVIRAKARLLPRST